MAHFFTVLGTVARRMGGTAEQWTAKALLRLDRRNYTVLHHLIGPGFDVDHVVVGRRGVLAVETKWTGSMLPALPGGHLAGVKPSWIRQAHRSRRWVEERLTAAGFDLPVTPVLVLWGPSVGRTREGYAKTGRIHVLVGEQSELWAEPLRQLLGRDKVAPEVVDALRKVGSAAAE